MTDRKKAATDAKVAESKSADKKPAGKKVAGESSERAEKIAKTITGTPSISKAGANTDADMKSAARKISDVDKEAADDSIKSRQSADELKARANEAKERAKQKILEESFVGDKVEDPLERLANTFDSSAKRWEMVVYPSLFAFVLLAGYGFFLIYRLTHDISTLSQSVTRMAVIVSDAMPRMTKDLNVMTDSIDDMTGNIGDMTGNIDGMSTEMSSMSGQMDALTPMSQNIQSMTHNIGSMNRSVYGMQRDMHGMNRTVSSGPFGMMNDMMPFSSNSNVPPPLPPPPVWPSYNAYPNSAYQYPATQQTPGNAGSQRSVVNKQANSPVKTTAVKKPGAKTTAPMKTAPATTAKKQASVPAQTTRTPSVTEKR